MTTPAFDDLWNGVPAKKKASIYTKAGHPVIDTPALDQSGHVPTHRLDQPTNRQPDEDWEQYQQRVLNRSSFSPDTAKTSSLSALEPEVADSTRSLLTHAQREGVNLSPIETRRSQERQEMLFQKGRTAPGDVATWTLTSDHTPGRAVDFTGDPAAYSWLQANAPKHGFSVMGGMDPGHVGMPDTANVPRPTSASSTSPAPGKGSGFDSLWDAAPAPVARGASGEWGDEPPAEPLARTGGFSNVSRAVLSGATLGAGNKLTAAGNALLDKLQGQPFGESYRARLQAERDAETAFRGRHPIGNAALELGGGIGALIASGGTSAPAELANVGRLARMAKAAATGFDLGAASGAINADGGLEERAQAAAKGGALGAAGGAILTPLAEGAGYLVGKTPIPRMVSTLAQKGAGMLPAGSAMRRALETAAGATGTRGQAASAVGQRMAMDEAGGFQPPAATAGMPALALNQAGPNLEGLAENIATRPGTGKTTIANAVQARQAQMRPSVVAALDQATGTTPAEGEKLLQRLADEQTRVAKIQSVAKAVGADARTARPARPSALQVWQDEIGPDAQNGIQALRQHVDEQTAEASRLYGAAREATRGQAVESPTLDEVMKTPAGQSAFSWARMQKGNRGSALPTVEGSPPPPKGFTDEQWDTLLERSGGQSVRDQTGKLRTNLGNVSEDALNTERNRLAELNAAEEALHGGVQDAGYRSAYGELPKTEKFGRKGQEDLPDADGMVDAERLAADNKIVSDFNKSKIVRAARSRAMDRIDTELAGRSSAGDFDYGANAGEASGGATPLPAVTKEVPDPETLHFMKQRLAQIARIGVNDGAQGTIATQAQGALGVWSKVRDELPDVWRQADDAYATKARVIDMLNKGRDLMRTQLNPAGRGRRALMTSLEGVEQTVAQGSPAEQQAFRTGAQSAVTDYLRSGGSPATLAKQLQDPTSVMSRRVALAMNDAQAPQRLAAKLAPIPQQLLAAPPVPALSQSAQGAAKGLDVLKYGVSAPGSAPERSLGLFDQNVSGMNASGRAGLQRGAAQALRGEFAGAGGSMQSPGRVFDFGSPERAQQMSYAFTSPQAGSEFQNTIGGWDRVAQQAQRLTGNSRTAARAAEEASRDPGMGSAVGQLFSGHPINAVRSLAGGMNTEATSQARQRLDQEIANILTSPEARALPEAQRIALFRRKVATLMRGSVPLGVVQQENSP